MFRREGDLKRPCPAPASMGDASSPLLAGATITCAACPWHRAHPARPRYSCSPSCSSGVKTAAKLGAPPPEANAWSKREAVGSSARTNCARARDTRSVVISDEPKAAAKSGA